MDRYVIIKKTIKTKFDEFMDHGRILYFGAPCGFGKTTVAFELLRGKKFELISGLGVRRNAARDQIKLRYCDD